MVKVRKVIILFAAFLILSVSIAGAEPKYPQPTEKKYINDYANIISDSVEDKVTEIGHELFKKTGAEVAVVLLEDTDGYAIEDYTIGLFRKWGIGSSGKNNGVLILIAYKNPADLKKSRIEVGYGLEGVLTDGKTGRIQDDYMIPSFKEGNYSQGILNGYVQVCGEVAGEYGVSLESLKGGYSNTGNKGSYNISINGIDVNPVVVIVLLILLFTVDGVFFKWTILRILINILFFSNRRGRGGGRFGGGGGFGGFGGGSSGGGGSSRNW